MADSAGGEHVIDVKALAKDLKEKMSGNLDLSPHCSIFKIPTILSRHSIEAKSYLPNAFSFGPFHHGEEKLKPTEKIKHKYLLDLLTRFSNPRHNPKNPTDPDTMLSTLTEAIEKVWKESRDYYTGPIGMKANKFVEVLVLDGCFIIELFRKKAYENLIEERDPIFAISRMLQYLWHDLILLENQIPWMVLDTLFTLTITSIDEKKLVELAIEFFEKKTSFDGKLEHMPSATTLDDFGIKFKMGATSQSILDIQFHPKKGELIIPPLLIHDNTDTLFRNLICLELYSLNYHCIITSYAMLFDNLIQTTTDMKVLCESGVISSRLHLEDATKIFNHPYEEYASVKENYYQQRVRNVDQYRRGRKDYYIRRWKVYRRELKGVYFSHPWAVISTVAASVMLILTFLQTLFTYMYR